jgi:hypothetical protein
MALLQNHTGHGKENRELVDIRHDNFLPDNICH